MSSVSVKFLNINAVADKLKLAVADSNLSKTLRKAIIDVKPQIAQAFVRAFGRTIVGKGLQGHFTNIGDDILAQFGFRDGEGIAHYNDISNVLQEAIEIGPFRKDRTVFRFRFQSKDLGELLLNAVDDQAYDSENGTVYWLEWLINGVDLDVGILYHEDKLKDNASSRSGRALMSANIVDWSTTDYDNFSETGVNFIIDMVQDPIWLSEVEDLVTEKMRTTYV
jgi:hypothetical protein